ncbi:MAG: DUF6496 domain-containing protein, partial [Myxococcota bacterium]
ITRSTTPEFEGVIPKGELSGRSLDQIREAADRVWHSKRTSEPKRPVQPSDDIIALVRRLPIDFPLTNLEKVLYPEQGARKHAKEGVPAAIRRVAIREEDGREAYYMAIRDLPGLLATAQLGALELHTWGSHVDDVEKPDLLVFDLDPDAGLAFGRVVEAAHGLLPRAGRADAAREPEPLHAECAQGGTGGGRLRSGRSGKKVTSREQAVAIGLSQARREGGKVPRPRRRTRR